MPPRKLVLHVGLPKTGTSALQSWCDRHRETFRLQGVNYPECADPRNPKHQFLVSSLMTYKMEALSNILSVNKHEILLLSTEGLTNLFYDFPSAGFSAFRETTRGYDIIVFMVTREAGAWTKSYYKQAVLNPPMPRYDYATHLTYHEFCDLPRVRRLVDIPTLRQDVGVAYGARELIVAGYEEDWMASFLGVLGIGDRGRLADLERIHLSVSDDLIELIRQVNAMQLAHSDRATFLAAVQACFRTEHKLLKHSYKSADPHDRGSGEILSRLVAQTPAQKTMIDRLSRWLYEAE